MYDAFEYEIHDQFIKINRELFEAYQTDPRLIIDLAIQVEKFIRILFNIAPFEKENDLTLFQFKREFVQRYALKKYTNPKPVSIEELDFNNFEQSFISYVQSLPKDSIDYENAAEYAAYSCKTNPSILFSYPNSINPKHLIHHLKCDNDQFYIPLEHQKERHGFQLTDKGFSKIQSLDQSFYCIKCHHQGKDSCSKGLKKGPTEELSGCPLGEKISQMHVLHQKGYVIAALAVIVLDNPMVAATGHRICVDCMRSCIFQKQDPVNTPGVETSVLKQVLDLPYGVEIYSLLTRWNPLNLECPYPKPLSGKKVLIVGMGPAGFTLAHYLLNEGHSVIGIDGLKIEPLRDLPFPIVDWKSLTTALDQRVIEGFGGVLEYGITARWDKNFLLLIRILLERRKHFKLLGGVRFGSTLTNKTVLDFGFQHIALCTGSGGPNLLNIPGSFLKGIRYASDFLMSLQLLGAFKNASALQIELPCVVIGGGLTAIDTATEALAYYPVQIKHIKEMYKGQAVHSIDTARLQRFLFHANQWDFSKTWKDQRCLLEQWGGVTLLFRKKIFESKSYLENHHEMQHALEEGIRLRDEVIPIRFLGDDENHVTGIIVNHKGVETTIPARSVFIAIGTTSNNQHAINDASDRRITRYGDLDPHFKGSVVKAMASAKLGYKEISRRIMG